eukprot:TRINITY_DN7094_c0_g1_i1.p1 TRINITY_DN7094_c0_g1~~TRINITY_DN7094_c0_g1_i1.p1  ORF type:complete len:813 (+),score=198.45 TRINITY_DN7094_c0_g1_i1:107-2545(+)
MRCRVRLPALPSAADFVSDVRGGLTLGCILLAQSLAHAALAHVDPINGPYSCLLPPVCYAIFGSSNHLIVGTGAILSVMTGTITGDAFPDLSKNQAERTELGAHLAVGVGIAMVVMAVLRMAALVNFLSRPALSGFTTGSAFIIVISQVMPMLGLPSATQHGFFPKLWFVLVHLEDVRWPTAVLGISLLGLILSLRNAKDLSKAPFSSVEEGERVTLVACPSIAPGVRQSGTVHRTAAVLGVDLDNGDVLEFTSAQEWDGRAPKRSACWRAALSVAAQYKELLAVGIGILTAWYVGDGVFDCIGTVPQGLPSLHVPSPSKLVHIAPHASVVAFTTFILSWAPAKKFSLMDHYEISPQREMLALGVANFAGGCSGGFPVQGGLSRTAIAYGAGVKSRLASVFVASVIFAALILLTSVFYFVPKTALAAIIISAAMHLTDFDMMEWLYHAAPPRDFLTTWAERRGLFVWLTAFAATLVVGIIYGVLLSSGLSLLLLLVQVTSSHVEELGRLEVQIHIGEHSPRYSPPHVPISAEKQKQRSSGLWRPLQHFHTAKTTSGITVLRPPGTLFFANIDSIAEYIEGLRHADRIDRRGMYVALCDQSIERGPEEGSETVGVLTAGTEVEVVEIEGSAPPGPDQSPGSPQARVSPPRSRGVVRGQIEDGWVTLRCADGERMCGVVTDALVLSFDGVSFVDEHALQRLQELLRSLTRAGTEVYIAGARGKVRLLLERNLLPRYDFSTPWAPTLGEAEAAERAPLLRRTVSRFTQRSLRSADVKKKKEKKMKEVKPKKTNTRKRKKNMKEKKEKVTLSDSGD